MKFKVFLNNKEIPAYSYDNEQKFQINLEDLTNDEKQFFYSIYAAVCKEDRVFNAGYEINRMNKIFTGTVINCQVINIDDYYITFVYDALTTNKTENIEVTKAITEEELK